MFPVAMRGRLGLLILAVAAHARHLDHLPFPLESVLVTELVEKRVKRPIAHQRHLMTLVADHDGRDTGLGRIAYDIGVQRNDAIHPPHFFQFV
jgi:hypothetical protein